MALVPQASINAADTAWMMTSTALVLLMTLPGIALFYAGMVRRKNVLATMAAVVAIAAAVSSPGSRSATRWPSRRAGPGSAAPGASGSRASST
jgi:hypothetical protein